MHVSAVSVVLSPRTTTRTRVSEKTAERIRELAEKLHYRPHIPAQLMRKRKTGLIGVLEFGRSEASSRRTNDLAKVLRARGYQVMVANVLWYKGVKEAVDSILNAQVEGVILVMLAAGVQPEPVYAIQDAGIACVAFNGAHLPGIPQVRSDVKQGVGELTRHLLHLGCKRLALLTSRHTRERAEELYWPSFERITAFGETIREAGGTFSQESGSFKGAPADRPAGVMVVENPREGLSYTELGYLAATRLLGAGELPDAMICSNDRYAFGALRACFEAGIQVPGQIAVVGFNGEVDARFFCPALTTVDILDPADAEAAVDLLLELTRGERPLNDEVIQKVPCRLIVRESCGAHSITTPASRAIA